MEVKAGYKQTEVGIVPEDWEVAMIGNLAAFASGMGISVASLGLQSSDTPIPVYGGNGIAGYTYKPLVPEPTVVIGRVGQKCGEVYLTEGPAWVTDNALYPRNIYRKLDIRFFALALKAAGLNNVKNRNDLPLITQTILSSVPIPFPPQLAEQKAIAEALSDADALIEALEQLIAKKHQVKQGAMQELLSGKRRLSGFSGKWELQKVYQFGDVVTGGTPPTAIKEYWNGDIPWVTPTDISGDKDIIETEREITSQGLGVLRKLPANSVLVTCIASIGKNAILKKEGACNQQINAVVPTRDYDADFLYYLFENNKQYLLANAGTTATSIISKRDFSELEFSVPKLQEQTAIAEILSDMDAEIAAVEGKLSKARQVKQGMMSVLLTGRIRLV